MAVKNLAWIIEKTLPPLVKLVGIILADASHESGICWPSVQTIIKRTGLSRRSVFRALDELESMGLVTRIRRVSEQGDPASSIYLLLPPWHNAAEAEALLAARAVVPQGHLKVPHRHPPGAPQAPPPSAPQAPQPSISMEPSIEPLLPALQPAQPKEVVQEVLPPEPKRGSRLPVGWAPDSALLAWADREVPGVGVLAETVRFTNYWTAKAGASATKLRWDLTWKNWMLEEAKRQAARRPASSTANAISVVTNLGAKR